MPSVLRKQVVILDISMGHPTDHTEITKRGGETVLPPRGMHARCKISHHADFSFCIVFRQKMPPDSESLYFYCLPRHLDSPLKIIPYKPPTKILQK